MQPAARVVACPQCSKSVEWTPAAKWRPFCSERCKLIDLGAWAADRYRLPAAEDEDRPDALDPDVAADK